MKEQLTGTDIRYIAQGYWRHTFNWGFHPRVKTPAVIALVSFLAGIAAVIGDLIDNPLIAPMTGNSTATTVVPHTPSAAIFVAVALVLVAAGFFVKAMYVADPEKAKFLDSVTTRWESGDKSIPDAETVTKFLGESK